MNLEQRLLLVAIVITFLLWRRARRQRLLGEAAARAAAAERTYTLEAREDHNGRGFAIIDSAGAELAPESLDWERHGLAVVAMHSTAVGLAPGTALLLDAVETGDGVEVIEEESGAPCGVISGPAAKAVRTWLDAGDVAQALVLWQGAGDGVLPRISILVIHRDVGVDA